MFDTAVRSNQRVSVNPTTTVDIDAVSGTLVKSDPESYIMSFDMDSEDYSRMFKEFPPKYQTKAKYKTRWNIATRQSERYDYKPAEIINVAVLQYMILGNNQVLVEFKEIKDDD